MIKPPRYLQESVSGACWRRSDRRRFEPAPRAHAELVGLHGLYGRMRYLIDGTVVELGPGSLLLAFPNNAHFLLSETSDFDMWVWVVPWETIGAGHFLPSAIDGDGRDAGARVLSAAASRELETIAETASKTDDPDMLALACRWWVARAWEHWKATAQTAERAIHRAVSHAAELIEERPWMLVDEVASEVGLSPGRLGRLFSQQLGEGLVAYRTRRRLEAVDRLVASQPDASVNLLTASLEAGFGSYTQFYRAFVSARGAGPREYYRNLASNENAAHGGPRAAQFSSL